MSGNAPNRSATGSQVDSVMKLKPNWLIASEAPCTAPKPEKPSRTGMAEPLP